MYADNQYSLEFLLAPTTVTADTESDPIDVKAVEGTVLIGISVAGGGTGTLTATVTEDVDSAGSFSAIDAEALFNPDTGEAATFAAVTTTESNQVLALNKNLCKRFVRVELTAGTSHAVCIVAVRFNKYANWSQF